MQVIEIIGIVDESEINIVAIVPAYQRSRRKPMSHVTLYAVEKTGDEEAFSDMPSFDLDVEGLVEWFEYLVTLHGGMKCYLNNTLLVIWGYEHLPQTTLPPEKIVIRQPKGTFDMAVQDFEKRVREFENLGHLELVAAPLETVDQHLEKDLPLLRSWT